MPARPNVLQAKQIYQRDLLSKANVVGVGVSYKIRDGQRTDELGVAVLVRDKVAKAELAPADLVPPRVDGVVTDVIQVGELRALQTRTDRWRPIPAGVTMGHFRISAGTFGAVVRDRATGERLLLSNNHVFANGNDAQAGDAILQPGPFDGGKPGADVAAHLARFVPIEFPSASGECGLAGNLAALANALARLLGSQHRLSAIRLNPQATNRIDAALARPVSDDQIRDEILGIGVVRGTRPARLLMPVRKSGRSTGVTTGEIAVIDTTVNVGYGEESARFEGQIVTGPMSAPGDSGSLLVAGDSLHAVGLLFAGSDQSTVYNPIQDVLDGLNIII